MHTCRLEICGDILDTEYVAGTGVFEFVGLKYRTLTPSKTNFAKYSAGLPPENGIFFICMRSEKFSVFSPKKPDIILLCLSGLKGRNKYLDAKHRKIYFFTKSHIKCMRNTVFKAICINQ